MLPNVSERSTRQSSEPAARQRVLELLRRHGWNATSFQVLEAGFSYWFSGEEACVAYVDTGAAWVAAGAPIAAEASLGSVARAFVAAAAAAGRRAYFFATEGRFAIAPEFSHLLIGEQPVWDPRHWGATLRRTPSLREQLRRARAKGVRVSAIEQRDLAAGAPLRAALEQLIASWQGSKPMPPMSFLVHVDPFEFVDERRLFVARMGQGDTDHLVGFAAAIPVYTRGGWFLEDLIRGPNAPNGTAELLVDAVMKEAARLGSTYFTLGLSPLAGEVPMALGLARRYAAPLYDFAGLWGFKAKFRPDEWAPIYLSYPSDGSALIAVIESLRAFARQGLLRYGIETLFRGPDLVIRGLGWLLVPWTALLAALDERWFPAPWVHWAWVGFDLVLCGALLALSRRFRPALSRAIVIAVSLDATLTLLQALVYNLPRIAGAVDALGVSVAVAAPLVASRILANAHRRTCRISRI